MRQPIGALVRPNPPLVSSIRPARRSKWLTLFAACFGAAHARAAAGFSIGAPITLPHSVHEPS